MVKLDPQSFQDVFIRVLLNRAGVRMTNVPYNEAEMIRNLESKKRLIGYGGDALAVQADKPSELQRIEKQEKKDAQNGTSGDEKWSNNAEELLQLVEKLGPINSNLSSETFVKNFFTDLRLPEQAIRELDVDICNFTRLTYLDVSRNSLKSIDNLPPNLKYFKAYNTDIERIRCPSSPSLLFLGLGHSRMGSSGVEQLARRFRNLLSLDLSYSELVDLESLTMHLEPLQRLKHVCFTGCPISLLPWYRLKVLRYLQQIEVLDNVEVGEQEINDCNLFLSEMAREWLRLRPEKIRLHVQLQRLHGARLLFDAGAKRFMAEKKAQTEAAVAAAAAAYEALVAEDPTAAAAQQPPAQPEEDERDAILQACAGGILRFRFQMPDGTWMETAEVPIGNGEDLAPEDASNAFDEFDLAEVKTPDGGRVIFDLSVQESQGDDASGRQLAEQDHLLRFCKWLRCGIPVKVFFRAAMPPQPGDEPQEVPDPKSGKKPDPKAKSNPPPPEPKPETDEPPEPVEPPEEVAIGGAVLALDDFLIRTETDVPEELRHMAMQQEGVVKCLPSEARETRASLKAGSAVSGCMLPATPGPWIVEVSGAQVAPMERSVETGRPCWLDAEVQVPQAVPVSKKKKGKALQGTGLQLSITLYEKEDELLDEVPPRTPSPEPPAKGKKK